jgi:hypothetical protein
VIGAWDGQRTWIYHRAVLPALRTCRWSGNECVADFYRKLGYAPEDLLFMTKLL